MSAIGSALSGIEAAQVGMDAVATNLANVQTAGYIRQSAQLGSVAGGADAVGSGVAVEAVTVQSNSVLNVLAQSTSAQAGASKSEAQALSGAQSLFNEPSSTGLQSQLSAFWSDWTTVANSPGSLAARTTLLGAANQVVDTLHTLAAGLTSVTQGTQANLSETIGQVNQQLSQMASLNKAVVAGSGAEGGQNGLVEQQQALAATLATEIGATTTTSTTGAMDIRVGGFLLVQGSTASHLAATGTGTSTAISVSGTAAPLPLTSGKAAGMMVALSSDLPSWSASLDAVAKDLAATVNGQLGGGVSWTPLGESTATSSAGTPMFVSSGSVPVSASTIEVNPTMVASPATIAAGSSASAGPLDGGNAAAMAALSGSSSGPDSAYRSLIGQIGSAVQSATAAETQTSQAATQAAAQASASEGVNTNAQLTKMLGYQQMYQAAGKVIGTAATMLNSLLAAIP